MIPEAQPKQGLETGSLEGASGLSTRDQVARNYEEDLSGKNGPTARFDTLRELIHTEISAALNEMRFSSGDGTQIFGRDGKFAVNQPTAKRTRPTAEAAAAEASGFPWEVVPDGESYRIAKPGRIYTSYTDIDSVLSITGVADSFSLSSGNLIYLKLTTPAAPAISLEVGAPPAGWPQTVKYTSPPDPPRVEEAYFILHEVVAGTLPEDEWGKQFESFYLKRFQRSIDSVLIWGGEEIDNNLQHVPIPALVPL